MPRHYSAGDAARALGISLDTLRRWDREGRIRVTRDRANRRVVSEREIRRLRGAEGSTLSARNRLEGVVREVKVEGLLADPSVPIGAYTRELLDRLGITADVMRNVVSQEPDVKGIVSKVALGEADAGF